MNLPVVFVSSAGGPRGARALKYLSGGARSLSLVAPTELAVGKQAGVRVRSSEPATQRLGQGCGCCTVRSDLREHIQGIAQRKDADRVLVHAPPDADLDVLAKTFTVADAQGFALGDTATFSALVVVVDVQELLQPGAARRGLVNRIEVATAVMVERGEAGAGDLRRALLLLRALNPGATVLPTGDLPERHLGLLDAGRFDLDQARARASLEAVLDRSTGSIQQGVLRLPFHARRPFHPARLHALLSDLPAGVVRARGTFWIASTPHIAAELDVALDDVRMAVAGHWWAAVPEAQRPSGPDFAAYVAAAWHPSFGDRRQELAFAGVDIDHAALLEGLQGCLLTDAELGEPDTWSRMEDPFTWSEEASR